MLVGILEQADDALGAELVNGEIAPVANLILTSLKAMILVLRVAFVFTDRMEAQHAF